MDGTPVHLLTQQAQWGTERKCTDNRMKKSRQTLKDCHIQKYGRARKSPSDKPESHCDLITTFFESTDKKKNHELMLL